MELKNKKRPLYPSLPCNPSPESSQKSCCTFPGSSWCALCLLKPPRVAASGGRAPAAPGNGCASPPWSRSDAAPPKQTSRSSVRLQITCVAAHVSRCAFKVEKILCEIKKTDIWVARCNPLLMGQRVRGECKCVVHKMRCTLGFMAYLPHTSSAYLQSKPQKLTQLWPKEHSIEKFMRYQLWKLDCSTVMQQKNLFCVWKKKKDWPEQNSPKSCHERRKSYLERVQLVVGEVGSLGSLPQFNHSGLPKLYRGRTDREREKIKR